MTMPDAHTILINRHLQKSQYVLLVLFVLGLGAGYFLHRWNPGFFSWVASPFCWILYVLYFIGTSLSAYINQQKRIVFSTADQAVYCQTVFGRKRLMALRDIGAIKPFSTMFGNTYFALFGRANLYGRNPVRISPNYGGGPKGAQAYAEFERTVLPQLRTIVSGEASSEPPRQTAVSDTNLIYFERDNDLYRLKRVYDRDYWSWLFIVLLAGASVFILLSPGLSLKFFSYAVGTGLGALVMAFLLTEKKYFQNGQLISEYKNGLFRKAYPLTQFSTYQIIHRRYNFVYVGTDVNMVFNQRPIFLCQMRKTERIETLIRETNHIVGQQVRHPLQ